MICPVGGAIFIRMIKFFWQTVYNMPYHRKIGYNMKNRDFASPIPTPTKVWVMMMFRPYLIGVHFTSWGDYKPLLPLFNKMTKAAPVRVARHRNKVQDLRFMDKYLPGKVMPGDYASRHAALIEDLTEEEREMPMVDVGENVQVMRVIMVDLPPAMTMEVLMEVAGGADGGGGW